MRTWVSRFKLLPLIPTFFIAFCQGAAFISTTLSMLLSYLFSGSKQMFLSLVGPWCCFFALGVTPTPPVTVWWLATTPEPTKTSWTAYYAGTYHPWIRNCLFFLSDILSLSASKVMMSTMPLASMQPMNLCNFEVDSKFGRLCFQLDVDTVTHTSSKIE